MFDPDRLYFADDATLKQLAPYSTLAHWRCQGKGPAFIRLGKRVAYRGADLNAWLESRTVRPKAA